MSRLLSSSVLLSVLCSAFSKEWSLNAKTQAAMVAGVGAGSDTTASAAASDNGTGASVERISENGVWTKTHLQAGLLLDSAVTPSGVTLATSIWGVFLSTDNGATYTMVDGVGGACQSANIWGANKEFFGLVGTWAVSSATSPVPQSASGVAYSKDGGATWAVSASVPPAWARYGSFPSENTWYVSSGMWGDDVTTKDGSHALTSRMTVNKKSGYTFNGGKLEAKSNHTSAGLTGWFGAVSKTTDGGKTWSQVFSTDLANDYIYFNGISCSSDSHCVVVGEGHDANDDYLTRAYVTFDAGVTWTATLTTSDVGLMGAKFVSETEGWLAGTKKDGRNLYGQFYRTTDGGKTWNLEQSLTNCYAIDMDFAETRGFAACSSSSGSSCSVAEYY